jgi:anaerobic selenocysteine-containing dehydrogenase
MTAKTNVLQLLSTMLKMDGPAVDVAPAASSQVLAATPSQELGLPKFAETELIPVRQADGRLTSYPPPDKWNDWVEWDGKAWPKKVARRYILVPTVCFNCESACGLLAYVDRDHAGDQEVRGQPGPSRQPRPELRQRPGHSQPDLRPGADPLSPEAGRRAGRGALAAD